MTRHRVRRNPSQVSGDGERLRRWPGDLAAALFGLFALGPGLALPAAAQLADVGLSAVRSQGSFHDGILDLPAEAGSSYGFALAVGDFNGDGADDLAAGIPWADGPVGSEVESSGAVAVRFGAPGRGLEAEPSLLLVQGSLGSVREPGDRHGAALAACDFDGDGKDDLAIGAPDEDSTASGNGSGAVYIHYGSASASFAEIANFYTQESLGVEDDSEPGDHFGESLVCGDFNTDSFADLVVGVPSESIGAAVGAGMIHILPGTSFGVASASLAFNQNTNGLDGIAESDDRFGAAFAVGRFDGDGFADLAIGVPGESCGALALCGVVQILYGSTGWLSTEGDQILSDSTIGGEEESVELFGFALASGDFNGDGFDDLIVGAPLESLGTDGWSGRMTEVWGSAAGLAATGGLTWEQDQLLPLGDTETNDFFGWALVAGDFDGDGVDDVVAGHPGESAQAASEGAVTVVCGAEGAGLVPVPNRNWMFRAGQFGIPGEVEIGRGLGDVLAVGDFDGNGHADLAMGAPDEDVEGRADAGAVYVLYGSLFSDGFGSGGVAFWGTSPDPKP